MITMGIIDRTKNKLKESTEKLSSVGGLQLIDVCGEHAAIHADAHRLHQPDPADCAHRRIHQNHILFFKVLDLGNKKY